MHLLTCPKDGHLSAKVAGFLNKAIEEVKGEQLPNTKEKRIEFMRTFRKEVVKNKNLLEIAKEVKTLCQKFAVP